jgi:hypothetical protein
VRDARHRALVASALMNTAPLLLGPSRRRLPRPRHRPTDRSNESDTPGASPLSRPHSALVRTGPHPIHDTASYPFGSTYRSGLLLT